MSFQMDWRHEIQKNEDGESERMDYILLSFVEGTKCLKTRMVRMWIVLRHFKNGLVSIFLCKKVYCLS